MSPLTPTRRVYWWVGALSMTSTTGGSLPMDGSACQVRAGSSFVPERLSLLDVVLRAEAYSQAEAALFADGFESGDTSAWSSSAGFSGAKSSTSEAEPTHQKSRGELVWDLGVLSPGEQNAELHDSDRRSGRRSTRGGCRDRRIITYSMTSATVTSSLGGSTSASIDALSVDP